MRNNFCDICINCKKETIFVKYNTKDICDKLHLFGFSFFGGIKYYTIREILVSFGIKKKALIIKCSSCNMVFVKCPHCNELIEIQKGLKEKCPNCSKIYYVCV